MAQRLTARLLSRAVDSPLRCWNVGVTDRITGSTSRASPLNAAYRASRSLHRGRRLDLDNRPAPTLLSSPRSMSTNAAAVDSGPMGLGTLVPAQPTKPRKRLGRGQGSGRGGTSTRGHKGQKARAGNGKPKPGFEGGQTPITRRYPKRGFTNIFAKQYTSVKLDRIQEWIDNGRLDPSKPITAQELFKSACVHSYGDGIKLLGNGAERLRVPLHLVVSRATPAAIAAVEGHGGSIVCKYYNQTSLRALVKPEKYIGTVPIREANPIHKRDLIYYSSAESRGYLASRVIPGEGVENAA